jgi:hypothetical protein
MTTLKKMLDKKILHQGASSVIMPVRVQLEIVAHLNKCPNLDEKRSNWINDYFTDA